MATRSFYHVKKPIITGINDEKINLVRVTSIEKDTQTVFIGHVCDKLFFISKQKTPFFRTKQ